MVQLSLILFKLAKKLKIFKIFMEAKIEHSSESSARRANLFLNQCDSPKRILELARATLEYVESDLQIDLLKEATALDEKVREIKSITNPKAVQVIRNVEVGNFTIV